MPTSEYDIAEVSGQDIFRLLPSTIRTRDPGVLASLCDAIANEHNYLARLVRILVQSNNPYEAGRFSPEQWGETSEALALALEADSPEPAPVSYHLEEVQGMLLDRLSENLGNRLEGVDRESLRRCIASAIQRYKVRGSSHGLSVSSQLGSVGETVSEDRWSNLSGSKMVRTPEVYPAVGVNQFPLGDPSYDPNSFDGTPESYEYPNPSFFPDESGQFLGNLMEGNPFVTISGVVSYLNPGKYFLTNGSSSSRASTQIPHLDKTVTTAATFTATFPGEWGNLVAVEVLYQEGVFVVRVSGPGTKVKYKTSRHQITHFVHLMLAAYAGIESEIDDKVVDLWQATGHMERSMRAEELIPLTRTPLEPTGLAAGIQDKVLYAISKPIRNPILRSVSKYWSMVVTGPDSGEWVEHPATVSPTLGDEWGFTLTNEDGDPLAAETVTTEDIQIIQQDEVDGKWYRWVVSDEGELSFVEVKGYDSSSLVTFQDRYAWLSGGILRVTISPPPLGSYDVPYGPYDVPPQSMSEWYGPDAIKPTEEWLVRDRPEDFLTNDSGSGNMGDHAGHYSEDSGIHESTGDIRHRLVGVTGGLIEPTAPYSADPMVMLLDGHGNYVWRSRSTNQPILTRWKGDGTMVHTILEVDGPIEGVEVDGLDPDGYLVSPTDLITIAPHGNLNQIYRPLTRFVLADSLEYGGNLKIDDDWSVGEVLYVGAPYNSLAKTDAFGATALSHAGSPAFYCRKAAEAALPGSGEVSVRLELESISSGFVVVVAHCRPNRTLVVLGQVPVNLGVVTATFNVPSSGSIIVLHNGQATGQVFIEWETAELTGVETFSSDRDLVTLEIVEAP